MLTFTRYSFASLFLFCYAAGAQSLGIQDFAAEGRITYQRFVGDKVAGEIRRSFLVSVVGAQWLIRSVDESDTQVQRVECIYDGTNLYCVSLLRDSNVPFMEVKTASGKTESVAAPAASIKNRANVQVWPSEVPISDRTLISAVWLAFASRDYFARMPNNKAEPFWFAGDGLKEIGFQQNCIAAFNRDLPQLPQVIVYLNPGRRFSVENGQLKTAEYPPPLSRGFTNALYEITEYGEYAGLTMPLRFRILRFAPAKGSTASGALRIVDIYEGETKNAVAPANMRDFQVHLPDKAAILDMRFARTSEVQSIQYYVTNGEVRGAAAMAPLYQQELHRLEVAKKAVHRKAVRRALTLTTLIAAAIGFPLAYRLYRGSWRNRSRQ